MNPLGSAPVSAEETLGMVVLLAVAVYLVVWWLRQGKPRPDPWEAEAETAQSDSKEIGGTPVCVRCLTPHVETAYFCSQCGHAVGPYNNYMPFLQLFSEGEVMRTATDGTKRMTPFTFMGYALLSLATFSIFAPVYWLVLLQRYFDEKKHSARRLFRSRV